eukprot:15482899-Alexandrium_andersonii.AAC.1
MIGYDEDTTDWYRAIHMQLAKSCDQAGRAHLGTLSAITQRRCFAVTHGECGADCVRQAITESTGGDVYAYEVTAEDESSRGPSTMVRVIDSATGPAAIPRLLAAGGVRVAGRRYD